MRRVKSTVRGKNVIKKYDFIVKPCANMMSGLAFCGAMCYNRGMKADLHTHSAFSPDGISPLFEMAAAAHGMGLNYLGVSEHFDYDYAFYGITFEGETPTDETAYFSAARALQREYEGKGMRLLVGGEYGFCPDGGCCEKYLALSARQKPDFIINSVHSLDGYDCYFPEYFLGKSREIAYGKYLERVRESLEAPYSYDIVGHIGYVARRAPYEKKLLTYDDFPALFDDILKIIIAKGKILEVNTSTKGLKTRFLPEAGVLSRYFELGGRRISFGSDAHDASRILEGFSETLSALKQIGFTALTVPIRGDYLEVKI